MKKIFLWLLLGVLVLSNASLSFAAEAKKKGPQSPGPAPNSGDGIPDGSGF